MRLGNSRFQSYCFVHILQRLDWLVEDQMADEIVYLNEGKAKNPFDVYAREDEPCPRCKTSIERMTFGGRSTYYCPTCQPSS